MASILKRGEYSYQATIRRRGFPSKTRTFDTKPDAVKWARMIEREMDRGAWNDNHLAESMSLADVLVRYSKEVTPAKKSADIEMIKISALLRDPICSLKMSALSAPDIAAWRDRRLKNVKGSSANREMAIITHAIEIGRKEWGLRIDNPCKLVRRAPASAPRTRRIVGDEESYLMEALNFVKSPYVKPMVILAIETAMRRSELLSLQWQNVNLEKRTALLHDTKNGSARVVPLSSRAIALLEKLPQETEGRVFPLTMDAFKKAFVRSSTRAKNLYKADCQKNGAAIDSKFMVGLRFHDMRHEGASRLFELGLNVMEVASITGHKTLQMLQRYTHLRAEDLAKKLG
ncbi:MAG: site-specific integrase [Burkholderiaceae bacterium]|nr:site-specific integrase [Burkholderiaceae bacterium]